MKTSAVKNILDSIIQDFAHRGVPSALGDFIKEQAYITGGCIPSMLMGEFVNDIDVYFRKDPKLAIKKSNFTEKTKPISDTENALTFEFKRGEHTYIIQLIKGFYGSPQGITDSFDWAHIRSYYDVKKKILVVPPETYRLITDKELIYTGSDYPLSSLLRIRKYMKKGWTMDIVEGIKIAIDIQKVNFKLRKELERHINGIDPMYWTEISDSLKPKYNSLEDLWMDLCKFKLDE